MEHTAVVFTWQNGVHSWKWLGNHYWPDAKVKSHLQQCHLAKIQFQCHPSEQIVGICMSLQMHQVTAIHFRFIKIFHFISFTLFLNRTSITLFYPFNIMVLPEAALLLDEVDLIDHKSMFERVLLSGFCEQRLLKCSLAIALIGYIEPNDGQSN